MYYFSPLLLSEYLFLVLLVFVTAENLAIGSQQGENPQHEWEWGGGHSWPASSLPWVLALDSSSPEVPLWEPCHGLTLYRQLFWVQMACLICRGSSHHTYVASPPWSPGLVSLHLGLLHLCWPISLLSYPWLWDGQTVCLWAWLKFSRKMEMVYLSTDIFLTEENTFSLEVTLVDSRVLRAGRSSLGLWVLGVADLRRPSPEFLPSLWSVHVTMKVRLEMEILPQLVYFSSRLGERQFL